jgi:hypothetical protein
MVTPVDRGLDEPIEVTGTVAATVTNPLPVSGAFYPATQPVSIASMPSTPVTGTFWPDTQPVSATHLDIRHLNATDDAAGIKLIDELGNVYGIRNVDNKPRVSSMPYTYDIAEGNVANHAPWSKIVFHAAIDTTELDMMPWARAAAGYGWKYVFPTGATTMTIVSDSIEDDADKTPAAGTGAYTVTVYYLTTAFVEKNVTVTMNGTTAVQIATDIYRIQNARIASAGTAKAAVGDLRIASSTPVTYGFISKTKTRQRQCVWTVPTGKTLYITGIAFSCAQQATSKYVRFTTRANYDNLSGAVLERELFMPFNEIALNNTGYFRELNPPTKLPATVDLKVSAISDAVAVGTCALRGWIE